MGGWTRNSLAASLPQPLLRWSSLWASVIRPVVHQHVMLRNRVPLSELSVHARLLCVLAHGSCLSVMCLQVNC